MASSPLKQALDSVKCQTCGTLLADYKDAVELFTTAVRNEGNLLRRSTETEALAQKCTEANNTLMEHLRQHRRDLSKIAASS